MTLQISERLPFVGHKPVRAHLAQADGEKPIADALNAEQLIVLLSDARSVLRRAIQQGISDGNVPVVIIRRFEFRSVLSDFLQTEQPWPTVHVNVACSLPCMPQLYEERLLTGKFACFH